MMNKIKNYFELNEKYRFDATDITSAIYVVCAIIGILGGNPTPLFLIGSAISTAFCWQARRINLIVLNVALFVLNLVSFIRMF
jgi:hypothetical protein